MAEVLVEAGRKLTQQRKGSIKCPTHEHLMDFVEERLTPEQIAVIIGHLAICEECRDYVRFYSEWTETDVQIPTEDEKARLRRSLEAVKRSVKAWRDFIGQFRYQEVAAAADGYDVQKAVAQRAGVTVFRSKVRGEKDSWTVIMPNPTGPVSSESELEFQVYDCDNNPVPSGVLSICGLQLQVEEGQAILKGTRVKEEFTISFRRDGGIDVPGDIDPDAAV